ncbi:HpcH/HpaI aldolase/citrate lyase family protein [Salinicola peritrichatus]|uniref:HpcH/HpaI aldolase/citrate lyase family protein n=1 Tax=Salinicola peritrichatus TaxID=1267424 RepID=UPI000DA1B077|nr:CoA ester lyase [Salinicola peritrichatus]
MPSPDLMRSALFVPANRPERIPKALAAGADIVIVDLEDAVAPEAKADARQALGDYLQANADAGLWIRINAAESTEFDADLAFCHGRPGIAGLVVPKAETAESLARVAELGYPLIALIESAAGLQALSALSQVEGVERLSFGALDLSVDLGIEPGSEGGDWILDQARYQIVLHSRLAGLAPPIETVHPEFRNPEVAENAARRAAEMGFGGMLCIHPQQVEAVHRGLAPSAEKLDWARRVIAAADNDAGAVQVDGQMIDAPVVMRARRLIQRAGTVQ